MGKRIETGRDVFDEAVKRIEDLYRDGHEVVVSFSGGKDSTVCLNLAVIAAERTGRLPVKVAMRDEEIMVPGCFEYCERVAARPDVEFHWVYACQPIINIFNRENPYWWVFDPQLPPEKWVRQPPPFAYRIREQNIWGIITPQRFPARPGKEIFQIVGIRGEESRFRALSVHAAGGHLTKERDGVRSCRAIYDWKTGDVWKAIRDNGWDYCDAYNTFLRFGVKARGMRIAPPTMTIDGLDLLPIMQVAFPAWFDRVCERCPGMRTAAQYGRRAVSPRRNIGETWEDTFRRECIETAPKWIAERSEIVARKAIRQHAHHSTLPLPQIKPCQGCQVSWKRLAMWMYSGDPFSTHGLPIPVIEPEFFRPGAGRWGGKPTF